MNANKSENPFTSQRQREFRSAGFFIFTSLFSGVFHYFFQVVASRELSAQDFAHLNGWFANLSVFFMLGGLLQYAANFSPARPATLRVVVVVVNGLVLLMLASWFALPGVLTLPRALIILTTSILSGWLLGQVQGRLWFGVLAVVNLLIATTKLAMVCLPLTTPAQLDRYAFGLYAAYLPALWLVSVHLWRAANPEKSESLAKLRWAAPVILSTATAVIPQFDLVLMSHTQMAPAFSDFARASLFYRAIYVLVFILAQWLLPRQIRGQKSEGAAIYLIGGMGLLLSIALTAVSPLIATWVLHWSEGPDLSLVFLSCAHMTLLALIFLRIQEACAQQRMAAARILLGVLICEALLQLTLRMPAPTYLLAAILTQLSLLGWDLRQAARAGNISDIHKTGA